MIGLTRKQQQILDFIQKWQRTEGATPTFQEIADQFGFRSLNSVTEHVRLLRNKGVLVTEPGKARSLRVVSPLAKLRGRIVDIPLFGSIPAGLPQAREQDAEGCVSVDVESLGFKPTRNSFALRVTGDSMIGRHILAGDVIVLEHGPDPRNGQVVAGYHNHNGEFDEKLDARPQYDLMLEHLDSSLVKMQFQVAAITSGYKAQDYFRRFPGRFISAHLQDYAPDDHKKEVVMGTGIVDWKDFFAAAKVGGLKYIFVEMESNPAIMEGCAKFLKSLG
jgi:repressor LexA